MFLDLDCKLAMRSGYSNTSSLDPPHFNAHVWNAPIGIKTIRIVIKIIRIKMSFQVRETGLSFEMQFRSIDGGNGVRWAKPGGARRCSQGDTYPWPAQTST